VGALLLAVPDDARVLRYAGTVQTGWSRAEYTELDTALTARTQDRCPLPDPPTAVPHGTRWVRPELTGTVTYREQTGGVLRHPAWQGPLAGLG